MGRQEERDIQIMMKVGRQGAKKSDGGIEDWKKT